MPKKRSTKSKSSSRTGPESVTFSGADLFSKIFNELALSRVRNRALLEALVEKGLLELADYVRQYDHIEAEDMRVFLDMFLMPRAQFEATHRAWLKLNRARYGFARSHRVPQVAFDDIGSKIAKGQPASPPGKRK